MAKAFQKIYTQITAITKATCSLKAEGVGNDELATVNGKLAQVVKIIGDEVTLQVFQGTEGIPTNAEVVFLGKAPSLKVSDQLAGRFFNAYGDPIDGGPAIEGKEVEIGGPSVNPVRRKQPSELIATGIAGIDLNNTLVSGQKIPFFADPDQPYNQVMANVALRAEADKIPDSGYGAYSRRVFRGREARESARPLDRYDALRRRTGYRLQPYGPDSFQGLNAGFALFRPREDLREGSSVPRAGRWRFYHHHRRNYAFWRRHHTRYSG